MSTSSHIKAILVANTGGVQVLTATSIPKPAVAPGLVLVRNHIAGVNMIDTYHRSGLYPLPLPFVPGRDGAGVIEAVADNVTNVVPGDRVAYLGAGSYAQYTAVNASHVVKIPPDMDYCTAVAAMVQGMTALALVKYAYPVTPGDWVLVHAAAGGTGGLIVQAAKLFGAKVIGTTSSDAKVQEATRLGAHYMIRYDHEDIVKRVMDITGGLGVKAVYDGVGKATFNASLNSLTRRGYLISFGNASGKVPDVDLIKLSKGNVYLARPTLFEYAKTAQEFHDLATQVFSLIQTQKLNIRIHATYPLEKVADAHKEIEEGKTLGKILLSID